MQVKKYKKISTGIYEIELDDRKIKLYDDTILKHEILTTRTLTEKKLEKIIEDNKNTEAYFKTIKYITTKMRSEKEIKEYLNKQDYSKQTIDFTIDKLKKEGYINEEKYIKAFIHDELVLSSDGPEKITFKLKQLGITSIEVEQELNKIEESVWTERIKKIAIKKYKTNKNSINFFKQKLYTQLISLGYTNTQIKEVIDSTSFEENTDLFIKEANKIWNKLSNKAEKQQLSFHFKNKMLQKGYDIEHINEFLASKKEY